MHTLISGYHKTGDQWTTTFTTSLSSRTTERVIGNLNVDPRQGVRDPRAFGKPEVERPRRVRDPIGQVAMSNYTPIIGSASNDLNDIRSILVTLRDNGKHGVIPAMYKEYDPTVSSLPDNTDDRWHAIGLVGISMLPGQDSIESIRSECHHVVPSGLRID